ncbi:MAG TPA: multicopper oxidase domain-containing protein [Nitrososphaera sp.]|nr:multicopper oxidase domain-containing protein [Nitrososphaera sp.]
MEHNNNKRYRKTVIVIAPTIAAFLFGAGIVAALAGGQLATIMFADSTFSLAAADGQGTSGNYEPKTIEYTLIAQETTLEIAPDTRVEAWTYNGTIPGPTLQATEGDRVIINFINKTPMTHTIHLHGDHEEEDDGVFQEVLPNEAYTYDFIAEPAGALMYHCHVMPVSQHIRMGLYGAFIVDPQTPLEPAREYVIVTGEYDTQNQLTENPEYVMFNGFADLYWENPLLARTNELVRIYLINLGSSPAFAFHIHGTLFDAIPSGVWENPRQRVQSWEVAAGNTAIFEVKWPWEGRYLFHLHGTPEEKGTMAYFNITDAPEDAVDGVDIAKTKSISMVAWQENLTRAIQKQDPNGKVTTSTTANSSESQGGHSMSGMGAGGNETVLQQLQQTASQSEPVETTSVSMAKGSSQKSSGKGFSPNHIVINVGDTVTWKNDDSTTHTVKSREEGLFYSGSILQRRSFEYTFTEPGTFEYYCSLHPWMTGTVEVE